MYAEIRHTKFHLKQPYICHKNHYLMYKIPEQVHMACVLLHTTTPHHTTTTAAAAAAAVHLG
jgi:hypothetical protein